MANITGSTNGESLTGTANADVISGLAGSDTISGIDGADLIYGNAGAITLPLVQVLTRSSVASTQTPSTVGPASI